MDNFIVIAVIAVIIGVAVWYVIRAKKQGKKCVGCPDGCCSAKKGEDTPCCCCGDKSEAK